MLWKRVVTDLCSDDAMCPFIQILSEKSRIIIRLFDLRLNCFSFFPLGTFEEVGPFLSQAETWDETNTLSKIGSSFNSLALADFSKKFGG